MRQADRDVLALAVLLAAIVVLWLFAGPGP